MKKVIMSAIMCVALMASTTIIAQDSQKKQADKPKTECSKKKEGEKKSCKEGEKKSSCCSKKDEKK